MRQAGFTWSCYELDLWVWAAHCKFVSVTLVTQGRIYRPLAADGEEEVLFTASLVRFQVHI